MIRFVELQSCTRACISEERSGYKCAMMRLFVAILLACFTLACSYEEPEFLAQLQDEIDSYAEDEMWSTHSRLRRDIDDDQEVVSDDQFKCKQQSKKSCCGKTNLFKRFADPDKNLGKACYEEVSERMKQDAQQYETQSLFSCDKYKMSKKLQYCIYECVGKKKNILNTNGTINTEEMKKYLFTELFKEDWQKELADKIVPKCMNEKYVEWPENEPGVRCNPFAVQFQHCLWKEFEMGCPRAEQKESKKCQKLRNHLKLQAFTKRKSS